MAQSLAGPEIERLIQLLARMPGLGPRSARRAVLHLMRKREELLAPLADAMRVAAERIVTCTNCGNLDTQDPCTICRDPRRDPSIIVVVESVADLWALERAGAVRASYHVLGATLSPFDGIGPEDLALPRLVERATAGSVREVILALNATVEKQKPKLVDCIAKHGMPPVGTAMNLAIDAAGELRALEYSQRLTWRGRAVLADREASTGGTLYRRALAGGAQATGGTTGIAVGQAADFVTLESDDLAYAGRSDDALLDSLVFAGPKRAIRTVWRRGRVVVENGRHVGRDAIEARYRRALDAVLGG